MISNILIFVLLIIGTTQSYPSKPNDDYPNLFPLLPPASQHMEDLTEKSCE